MNLITGLFGFVVKADLANPAVNIPGGQTGVNFFSNLLPAIVSFLLVVAAVCFLALLILGSIQWISAGGDKGSIEAARSKITAALIGFIVSFGVFAIVNMFGCVFGIDPLRINIGELDVSFGTSPLCPAGSTYTCNPPCNPGYICQDNTCVADPNWNPGGGQGSCTCSDGEVTGNSCTLGNPVCIGQSTCICATGSGSTCTPPCSPGYVCQNNTCVQDPYASCACGCTNGIVSDNRCGYCPAPGLHPTCLADGVSCACSSPTTITPTISPNVGTCQCDLSAVVQNDCNSPNTPRCIGQFGCVCETPTCSPVCPNGWFCSFSSCCRCDYGLSPVNEYGPVTCCPPSTPGNNCETHNVYGCNPAP